MLSLRGALPGSVCYIRTCTWRCAKDRHSAKSFRITTVAYASLAYQVVNRSNSLGSSAELESLHSDSTHHISQVDTSVPMHFQDSDLFLQLPPLDSSVFRSGFWRNFKSLLNNERFTEVEELLIREGNVIPPRLLDYALKELSQREAWQTISNVVGSKELKGTGLSRYQSLGPRKSQHQPSPPNAGLALRQTLIKYQREGNVEMALRAQDEAVLSVDNSLGDRRSLDVGRLFEDHKDALRKNKIDSTVMIFDPFQYRKALTFIELGSIIASTTSICFNHGSSDVYSLMARLRQSIQNLHLHKDVGLCSRVIAELLQRRMWDEVVAHFDFAMSSRTPLSSLIFVKSISKLLHFQAWNHALRVIDLARRQWDMDPWFLEHRILCLMMLEDLKPLKTLPEDLAKVGGKATGGIFNNLVRAHLRNNDVESARSALQQMVDMGLPISDATMEAVIDGKRYMGLDVDLSSWISKRLDDPEYLFPTTLLDSTVQLYIQSGYYGMARKLVERYDMEHNNISSLSSPSSSKLETFQRPRLTPPSTRTWLIIMNLAAKENDLLGAVSTFNGYITSGRRLTTYMANALTRAYLLSGDLVTGFSLLAGRCRHDTQYSHDIVEPILGQIQSAINSLQSCLPPPPSAPSLSTGISTARLNPNAFADFISIVCRRPQHHVVGPTLELAKHMGLCHGGYLLSAALNINQKSAKYFPGLIRTAGPLLRELKADNVDSWMLHKLTGTGLRSERNIIHKSGWLHSWRDLAYPPPPSTKSSRLSLHSPTAGLIPSTSLPHLDRSSRYLRQISKSLREKGVLPRRSSFAMMIQKQGVHQGDVKAALKTFRVMVERGIMPDNYHYGALMYAYACHGRVEDAERIMRAYERGLLPSSDSSMVKWEVISPPRDRGHPVLWEILIYAYGKISQPESSLLSYNRMIREDVSPTPFTLVTLVKSMLANRDVRRAKQILIEKWNTVANGGCSSLPVDAQKMEFWELFKKLKSLQRSQSGRVPKKTRIGHRGLSRVEAAELFKCVRTTVELWPKPRKEEVSGKADPGVTLNRPPRKRKKRRRLHGVASGGDACLNH